MNYVKHKPLFMLYVLNNKNMQTALQYALNNMIPFANSMLSRRKLELENINSTHGKDASLT